jgi:hypothetical protein
MLFESSYKRVQRACHDRSHGQATASRVIPQQSHRAKNKVGHQENWGQNARGVEDQTIRRLEETKQVYPLRDGKPMGLTAVTGQQAICCRADSIDVQAITFIDGMMSANESLQTVYAVRFGAMIGWDWPFLTVTFVPTALGRDCLVSSATFAT